MRRSTPSRFDLRRFAGRLAVALVVVVATWMVAAPVYNRVIGRCSGAAFALLESPDVTRVEATAAGISVLRRVADGSMRPFMVFDLYVYAGLIPLVALILATPGIGRLRRLRILGVGLLLIAGVHVLFLVGAVRLLYVAYGLESVSPGTARVCQWAQVFLRILWEGSALVIWAALLLGAWRRGRPAVSSTKAPVAPPVRA